MYREITVSGDRYFRRRTDGRLSNAAYVYRTTHATGAPGRQCSSSHQQVNVLIDTTPEFRVQALRFGLKRLDAVLFTHTHADHIFGFDDLAFFQHGAREIRCRFTARIETLAGLRHIFSYAFSLFNRADPNLKWNSIRLTDTFEVAGLTFTPISVCTVNCP